jgi:hypothetical protein
LRLESEFAARQRYTRIWGNHDDLWQDEGAVEKYLYPFLGNTKPVEAARFVVTDNGSRLGELFFAHGHQGTGFSDRYAHISKPFVRYVFNPLQRLLEWQLTTPATNYDLRYQHERAMVAWSKAQDVILVTGHTHRPVFTSETHGQYLREELAELKAGLKYTSSVTAKAEVQQRIYQKTAELHWVLAQTNGLDLELSSDALPCYFNPGCCSFSDGDITGLEIENGEIRLVRWPDQGNPWKRVLRRAGLREVLEQIRAAGRVSFEAVRR